MTKSIINETQKQQIEKIRKIFFRVAVYIFIGAAALGALMILIGGSDAGEYIGKTIGTLVLLGGALVVSSFDFRLLLSKRNDVQILALIGTVTNVLWLLFWVLLIWEVAPIVDTTCRGNCAWGAYSDLTTYNCCTYYPSVIAKLAAISSSLSSLGLFGAALMNIKEYDRKKSIAPIKITGLVCLVFCSLYMIVMTILNFQTSGDERFGVLAAFASLIWFISVLIAFFMSRNARNQFENKNKLAKSINTDTTPANEPQTVTTVSPPVASSAAQSTANANTTSAPTAETEAEMRARIEEKVRQEMKIEAEIRARLEKEQAEENHNDESSDTPKKPFA